MQLNRLTLPLYTLNTDKNYDLLFAGNLHENITKFLYRLGHNFPYAFNPINTYLTYRPNRIVSSIPFNSTLMLFQRQNATGIPYADLYSRKLYEFYKEFSTTGQYDSWRFSANLVTYIYQGERRNNALWGNIDFTSLLGDRLQEKLASNWIKTKYNWDWQPHKITNTTDKPIHLSYYTNAFAYDGVEDSLYINYNIARNVGLEHRGKVFNIVAKTLRPNEHWYVDRFCLMGSVVVSDVNANPLTSIEKQLPSWYLYKNLEEYLLIVWDDLRSGFKKLGQFCHYRQPNLSNNTFRALVFKDVPTWYRYATLIEGKPNGLHYGTPIKIKTLSNGSIEFSYFDYASDLLPDVISDYSNFPIPEGAGTLDEFNLFRFEFSDTPTLATFENNYDKITQSYIDGVLSRLDANGFSENVNMPDSNRIIEIHAALNAGYYAYEQKGNQIFPRIANLGYLLERIARVLGILVNPDGSPRSIRQSKHVPQGAKIPAGWLIGQWGINEGDNTEGQKGGNKGELREGIAYEVIGNKFDKNPFTGEPTKIQEGGYVLCENLFQYLEILKDDIDKCLGLQSASANAVPNAEKTDYMTYEGMHTLLLEIIFMLSAMSKQQQETWVSSLSTQAMSQEILAAFGTSIEVKEVTVEIDGKNYKIPYPGLDGKAPTMLNLFSVVLQNISPILMSVSKLRTRQQQKEVKGEELEELDVGFLSDLYDHALKTPKQDKK